MSESSYPLTFRDNDAQKLGQNIRLRHNVTLVGMKRVGISNFLRFFLYNKGVEKKFIKDSEKHLFIPVDLNDLVEREVYPFWTLVFKRILDSAENLELLDSTKQKISASFLSSIQSQDLFLLIDGVRRSLTLLLDSGYLPTLFLIRFDRIKDVITPEFFANLQGLQESLRMKLTYVFTSYRPLDELSPEVFTKASLSAFSELMYLLPAEKKDTQIIFNSFKNKYNLDISSTLETQLISLVDGYIQYLQISLILLHEKNVSTLSSEELTTFLLQDERILLQSEELWESFTHTEKLLLQKLSKNEGLTIDEIKMADYLIKAGVINKTNKSYQFFSPLFSYFVTQQTVEVEQGERGVVFSKKEHLLFTFLHKHLGEISEREEIIEAVWPEYVEFGVSDWSIDRLIARVRGKLKEQASRYEIKTVRTRGYVLISKS